ncbi:ABC transporter substrate-binding protein [Lederbergia sp. NSJ-179]|uniref:ABC transporter substrate-binding protein n=1 Tax=Lederbergia sp. NSJ-179 TaxID=2931402 RepID=UPI001FD0B553|nr:ABC transporter substrate-binding protein [Lederbergia sp. NSJ-179]MCJ7839414.1 ABC transporter substrate-binding protein [Lederbergia sp. NSJ-179]
MKSWRKKGFNMLFLLFSLFLVAGCSSEGSGKESTSSDSPTNSDIEQEEEVEPVTLLMMTHWGDEQFVKYFKEPVEEKFDHITLEHVQSRWDEIEENVFAKQLSPDLIMTSVSAEYLEMDLLLDLTPYIEEFNFELDRLEPSILDYLKEQSNEGELNGLPLIRPDYALVYNPDIFDLFGVDYPTDDMTWDEVIELARKVTGDMGGVHYRGLHPGNFDFMMRQTETPKLIDPDTNQPKIDENEAFKIYLQRLKEIYSIPGNALDSAEDMKDVRGVDLMRKGQLAMAADRAFAGTYASAAVENGLNFNFVTYPRWGGEYGDYGPNEPGNGIVATTISKHPKEAFRVIDYLLSDEYQMIKSENGDLPAVVTPEVREAFMKGHEHYEDILKDKNLSAITDANPAPLPRLSPYESEIMEGVDYREGIFEGKDINTIIREMQEKAEGNAKSVLSKN